MLLRPLLTSARPVSRPIVPARTLIENDMPPPELRRTALHELHQNVGAKMGPYAGWHMPIDYPNGVVKSVEAVRNHAGLFDVSHMWQAAIRGKDAIDFLQKLASADYKSLAVGQMRLGLLVNPLGGIIDDFMTTREPNDEVYCVFNAGCADKDREHLRRHMSELRSKMPDVRIDDLSQYFSLLAIQGPEAAKILRTFVPRDDSAAQDPAFWDSFSFMTSRQMLLDVGGNCRVSRCGYTGEDGFELAVPANNAERLAKALTARGVEWCGLASRDVLRLEAGLCLMGNDMSEDITPVESSLMWMVPKHRRTAGSFFGVERLMQQMQDGVNRKRVGLIIEQGIARRSPDQRHPTRVFDAEGRREIGWVSSGTHSPTLKKGIAMAFIDVDSSKLDTRVQVMINGKLRPAVVSKMPFVPTKYHKPAQ